MKSNALLIQVQTLKTKIKLNFTVFYYFWTRHNSIQYKSLFHSQMEMGAVTEF